MTAPPAGFLAELKRRNVFRVAAAYVVLSWLVLQVADVLVDAMVLPEGWTRAIIGLVVLGFIPALVFSWVYEMTPDGLKRESAIPREASITAHTARKLDLAVIVLLVMAMGLFAADRLLLRSAAPSLAQVPAAVADGRTSIAVLPFLNLSGDPENEYFSDGLTETLLHMLAQIDGLRVAARTSAFAFKGRNEDIREIAAQLNVSTVLEGSVQRSGQRVRITAQLIDAGNGSHLWSENFDRQLDDLFAIQDEIAGAVAEALSMSLLGETTTAEAPAPRSLIGSVSTRDTRAFDHYLRGLAARALSTYAGYTEAEQSFKQALLIDPRFREARLALVFNYLQSGDFGMVPMGDAVAEAQAALVSLLDAESSDPVVSGYATFLQFQDQGVNGFVSDEQRLAYLGRMTSAIALAPNEIELYEMAAEILRTVDSHQQQALALAERGLGIDPLSTGLLIYKAAALQRLEREDDALSVYARMREVDPSNPAGAAMAAILLLGRGDHAEAAKGFAEAAALDPRDYELPAFMTYALMGMGLFDEVPVWLERAELLNPRGGATLAARLNYLFWTGRREEARELAEDVLETQSEDRRGVLRQAASIHALEMYRLGRIEEAFALYETLAPGSTSDPGFDPDTPRGLRLCRAAQGIRSVDYDAEQLARWRAVNEPIFDRNFPGWREDDDWAVARFQFGLQDLDSAAEALARDLRADPGYLVSRKVGLQFPARLPLLEHPVVQAALAELESRAAEQAAIYRAAVERGEIPGA